jgi:hypothetical protein
MATPLNVFRTVTSEVTTAPTVVYSTPPGFTAIILMAQVTNITSSTGVVTFTQFNGVSTTHLLKDFSIPGNDAIAATVGKLVLESGHSISILSDANDVLELTLSVLETLNG